MTNWDAHMATLRSVHAAGFGVTATLTRPQSGGAFNAATGTETGGSTVTCTVRLTRTSRQVLPMQDGAGGWTKVEETVYEITPEDLASPLSGAWGIGDLRHGDRVTESAENGDGKARTVSRVHRAPSTQNYVVTVRTPATLGG